MGKVKATELLDTKVEYVSFVEEGANGREFKIFKSADYASDDDAGDDLTYSIEKEEDKNIIRKMIQFIKGNLNKEETVVADIEKILSAIEGLTKAVSVFVEKFDCLEKKLLKEGEDIDTQQPAGDESEVPEGDTEGDGGDPAPTSEEVPDEDPEGNTVVKAVQEMTEKMEKMSERLEKLEKMRVSSNSIQKDEKEETTENIFAGAF